MMADNDPCNKTIAEGLDCCVNFFSQNGTCLPCLPGFFGQNCSSLCPLGTFGNLCGGKCVNCSIEDCRRDYGCPITTDVTQIEIEETSISSTLSSSLPSKSIENLVSTPVKVVSTEFTTKFTQQPNVITVLTEKTNSSSLTLIIAGAIILLLLVILLAVLRKLWVMHMQRNYQRNEIESKHFKDGNEEDEYQEIDVDHTMAYHGDVSGNRYNIIMEELEPLSSKSQYSGSETNKEGTSTYSHYQEIDNENSSSNGNNGGYIEPKSQRPTHSYIEVIEPIIHASDQIANSDQDGSSSNKSDHLEEYQDTMNIRGNDKSCSDDVNEQKPHDSSMSDTYLDVVHDLS